MLKDTADLVVDKKLLIRFIENKYNMLDLLIAQLEHDHPTT